MCTRAPALFRKVVVNEIPNFTGVSARPRFTNSCAALNASTAILLTSYSEEMKSLL